MSDFFNDYGVVMKKLSEPLFSIITVCLNSENTIKRTIESVLNQSFTNYEYIVVDGKSSDRTIEIAKMYKKEFKEKNIDYRIISEPDTGIYNAMNKGIRNCKGKIIGILNSDDYYEITCLENVYNAYAENSLYDIYHGICRFVNNEKVVMLRGSSSSRLKDGMIEHPACFVKRETYSKFGYFDEKYKFAADYDLMLRFKKEGAKFCLIDKVLVTFDECGAGNSSLSRKEALIIKNKYHLFKSKLKLLYEWCKYMILR